MNATDHPPPPTLTDRGSMPGTPRWVKVSGIIALVAVVLVAVMLLAGGGQHGPGRHVPSGAGHTPPAGGQAPR